MVARKLFSNYELEKEQANDASSLANKESTYVHPFLLKILMEYTKEMHSMGIWNSLVNEAVMVVEVKGYIHPIYIHFFKYQDDDAVIFFEGKDKYTIFLDQIKNKKILILNCMEYYAHAYTISRKFDDIFAISCDICNANTPDDTC